MADESVSVRINLQDAITAGLIRVERQAKRTERAIDGIDRGGSLGRRTKKSAQEVTVLRKGIDKLRHSSNNLGFVLKTLKIPVIAAAVPLAAKGISAIAAAATAAIGPLGRMVGIMGAIPAGIGLLGTTIATFKMGMNGVSDLLKVMTKQGATVQEVNEAMKGMSPAAIGFAKALVGVNKQWKKMREGVQAALLPGLGSALKQVLPLISILGAGLELMAKSIGRTANMLARLVSSADFKSDLTTFFQRNAVLADKVGIALTFLVSAFRHVAIAAGPFVDKLADTIVQGAKFLNFMAASGRATGRLEAWFLRAWETTKQLFRTITNFAVGLYNVFKVGNTWGDSMYDSLEKVSAAFRRWTGSAEGQKRITKWFEEARPILGELGKLVLALGAAFATLAGKGGEKGGLLDTLVKIRTVALPAVMDLLMGLKNGLGPAVVDLFGVVVRIINFGSFDPLVLMVTTFARLATAFMDAADASPALKTLATAIITLGLAFKTANLVTRVTGMQALAKGLPGMVRGTGRMVKGMRAGRAAAPLAAGVAGPVVRGAGGKMGGLGRLIKNPIAVTKASGAFLGLKAALAALTSPIGLVVAGVALLIGAVVLAYFKIKPFREWVDKLWQSLQVLWDTAILPGIQHLWQFAQKAWDVFLKFTPLGILLNNLKTIIPAVWQAMKWVWGILSEWIPVLVMIWQKFTPLGQFFDLIRDNWGLILSDVKAAWEKVTAVVGFFVDKIQKAIDKLRELWQAWRNSPMGKASAAIWNTAGAIAREIPGVISDANKSAANRAEASLQDKKPAGAKGGDWGDTKRPRGFGFLGRTMALHAQLSKATPGRQYITNINRGGFQGSDHHKGKALDLKGSNLGAYRAQVKAMGGYAEFHGSGPDRHLHSAYGDTARPRAGAGEMGSGTTIQVGTLIGTVVANQEIDVERAARRALEKLVRDRQER